MLNLKSPEILFLFLAVPVLIYLIHFRKNRGGILELNLFIWKDRSFGRGINWSRIFGVLLWILFWTGLCLLIFALSNPILIKKEKIFLTRGIDMIIVLDESPSMSADDFKPVNRFVSAKKVIRDFTQARENDPIGLVTFSSEAIMRVPPTVDYNTLLEVLDGLQLMELGEGTAIGKGIAVAALHLKSSPARTKVIILITDGVNNEGDITPETATRLAAELGIRIYTIGIGKTGDTSWKFTDPNTGTEYIATSGEFDEKLLREIARLSGGKYFYAGKQSTLQEIFQEIDSREKTEKRIKISVTSTPVHNTFIFWGMALVFISFTVRKGLFREIF